MVVTLETTFKIIMLGIRESACFTVLLKSTLISFWSHLSKMNCYQKAYSRLCIWSLIFGTRLGLYVQFQDRRVFDTFDTLQQLLVASNSDHVEQRCLSSRQSKVSKFSTAKFWLKFGARNRTTDKPFLTVRLNCKLKRVRNNKHLQILWLTVLNLTYLQFSQTIGEKFFVRDALELTIKANLSNGQRSRHEKVLYQISIFTGRIVSYSSSMSV